MLEFVPCHMGLDHPCVQDHPEWFVPGTGDDPACEPHNYTRLKSADGPVVPGCGSDPYFWFSKSANQPLLSNFNAFLTRHWYSSYVAG